MWCAVIEKPGSARLEGTPAVDLGHMKVLLKWCICMLVLDLGIVIICIIIIICFLCFVLFCVLNVCCAVFSLFLFPFSFLEFIKWWCNRRKDKADLVRGSIFFVNILLLFCSAPIHWFWDPIFRTNWDICDVDKLSWDLQIVLGPHW